MWGRCLLSCLSPFNLSITKSPNPQFCCYSFPGSSDVPQHPRVASPRSRRLGRLPGRLRRQPHAGEERQRHITLFAFDAGQGLTEHTSPFDALVHVLDGEAWLTFVGQLVRACAGEVVLTPANQPHALSRFRS
ncbi:MAG: cupin domain-containing protein [Terriglobales bacterium]